MKGNLLVMLVLMSFISSPLKMLYGVENNNQKEKDFLTFVEKGKELYKEKKFDEAQKAFNQAKEIKPEHNGPYLGIGLCQEKLGQYEAAEKEFLLALGRANDNQRRSIICDNLGYLYHLERKYDESINYYTKAIEYSSEPKSIYIRLADAYYGYSVFLRKKRDYQRAEEMIKKAIDIDKESGRFHTNYGNILLSQKKYNRAVEESQKAIDLGIRDHRLFFLMAVCYERQKDYQDSIKYASLAIQFHPKMLLFFYNDRKVCAYFFWLGEVYYRVEKYIDAIQAYQMSLSIKEYSKTCQRIGHIYFDLKDYQKAIEFYKNAVRIRDDFSKKNRDYIYHGIARCYFELKKYKQALRYCDKAINANNRYAWAYEKKGEIYFLKGDQEASIRNFDRASELTPQNAKLHLRAGWFIYNNTHRREDCRRALIYLNKAYAIDSKNVDSIYLIAASYYRLDEIEKASGFLKIGLSIQPDYEDLNKLDKKIQQKEKENRKSPIILNPSVEKTTKL